MDKLKYSVIGAGVIGLAVAYKLSQEAGADIAVFEKNASFGQETSSRNSEVIHAGIYYIKDSLKSSLCLSGNKMLYEFCKENGISHRKCGKLIVATNTEEEKKLKKIYENALSLGVPGLELIGCEDIKKLEPEVSALAAIYSRTTGIIDSHGLMKKLYELAEKSGAMFSFNNEVAGIRKTGEGYVIRTSQGDEVLSEFLINCAGLGSEKVAKMAGLDTDRLGYRLHFCKGDYFAVSGAGGRLKHLVYPPPHEKGYGLGVHATIDLSGRVRLGPDTAYVDNIFYDIDPAKAKEFYLAAKRFLPWLKEEMVVPDTSGMRPKLQGPDDGIRDFMIKEESGNGLPGFINLIGIESPGLTSCLAIGEYVGKILNPKL